MEDITITNATRPSNDVVFGLVFEDMQNGYGIISTVCR